MLKSKLEMRHFPRGTYDFASLMVMPDSKAIKVGLLAQAPTGNGGKRIYGPLTIERRTVKNIRAGE